MIKKRIPIVTILGHVDHGKTTLLDSIIGSKKVLLEPGGITQYISAYYVKTKLGYLTFIDTPGHVIFSSMRIKGINITDIVVLVIAVDDGIMPQTIEVIKYAKNLKIPIIIALNKIDKTSYNIDNIKNNLINYGLVDEKLGGDIQYIKISALLGLGIDNLIEAIFLQYEIMELNYDTNILATGIVLESYLDKNKGPISTIIIRNGILHTGEYVSCGLKYGRIKNIFNEKNKNILHVEPSIPVNIVGLSGLPISGDILKVLNGEKEYKKFLYLNKKKIENNNNNNNNNKINILKTINNNILNIILKTDVQGTLEVISNNLLILTTQNIKINLINIGIGKITENDLILAQNTNSIIIGFNVKIDLTAQKILEYKDVEIYNYDLIYKLIEELKEAINNFNIPEFKLIKIGEGEVRNKFISHKLGAIAGCIITKGIFKKNYFINIKRNKRIIFKGKLESLKRFKKNVDEVSTGIECGIGIKNYNDIRIGDIIELFEYKKIK